jgi:hypothetical protein
VTVNSRPRAYPESLVARPLRGFLIGPCVAPLGYWLLVTTDAVQRGAAFSLGKVVQEGVVIGVVGMPLAYAVALIWGLPVVWFLRGVRLLRSSTVIAAGCVGGVALSLWLGDYQRSALFPVRLPAAWAAILGGLSAAAFLMAARAPRPVGPSGR